MFVKDFTMGILIMVLSLFPMGIVNFIITPVDWWVLPLVIFLILTFHYLFNLGWQIAFNGIKIDVNKK
jgi:hypothetical protein